MHEKITLLIVEDDESLSASLEKSFRKRAYDVLCAAAASEAKRILRAQKIDLVLLDIHLPDASGLEVLHSALEIDSEILVIMMTAFPEIKTAVRTLKEGAYDFIVKPFELEGLHLTVEKALETRGLRQKVRRLEHEKRRRGGTGEILGESPCIASLRSQIQKVSEADTPVLVVGETGTGKELVADSVHRLSSRARDPLVKANCSAFSENLLESEIFGHEKGAFTDAKEARPGLFEMADGGTLFLDEISEMKPGLQAKFLRVIEGQPFRRVGGQREVRSNVRIVATTNRDLPALVRSKDFREDLYFRLKVFQIDVPPLRSRGKDVILLARFYLRQLAADLRKGPLSLASAAEEVLLAYPWPGNVRELCNVVERAVLLSEQGEVDVKHLPAELQSSAFIKRHGFFAPGSLSSLGELERQYIAHVLEATGGNISEAARILGISRNTLKAKL